MGDIGHLKYPRGGLLSAEFGRKFWETLIEINNMFLCIQKTIVEMRKQIYVFISVES